MNVQPRFHKRFARIERLSKDVGATVGYPLGQVADIAVYLDDGMVLTAPTLRKTESLLRRLKRKQARSVG